MGRDRHQHSRGPLTAHHVLRVLTRPGAGGPTRLVRRHSDRNLRSAGPEWLVCLLPIGTGERLYPPRSPGAPSLSGKAHPSLLSAGPSHTLRPGTRPGCREREASHVAGQGGSPAAAAAENAYHSEFQAAVAKETRISSSQCPAPDSRGQDGGHEVGVVRRPRLVLT